MMNGMRTPNGRSEVIDLFGNPANADGSLNEDWKEKHIVSMPLPSPMKMVAAWDKSQAITRIQVHASLAPILTETLIDLWNTARIRAKERLGFPAKSYTTGQLDAATQEELNKAGMNLYGGGFAFRNTRGAGSLSMHAYGIALDFDPERNALGSKTWHIPDWVIVVFARHGWLSGTKFKHRKDAQHFQFATGC